MTKRYTILQKKLVQLQTQLAQVFALPPDTPYHQLLSEGIEQRLDFLKNLLSAEIASHPSRPHHLLHIDSRLTELESTFREWDEYRNTIYNNASVCSCTESLLNDDGEGSTESGFPEIGSSSVCEVPESFYETVVVGGGGRCEKEEAPPRNNFNGRVVIKGEKWSVWVWRYCGVMVMGMLIGAILTIKFSRSCFPYADNQGFRTPT